MAAASPTDKKKKEGPPVFSIADLEKEGTDVKINPDTLGLNWKVNTSPGTIDGYDLKQPLCTPLIKKIDLVFPTGIEVTARNLKGVTIRDALDAIHKQLKKKADDELDLPYLKGFEWDKETSFTKFNVHFQREGAPQKTKKKSKGEDWCNDSLCLYVATTAQFAETYGSTPEIGNKEILDIPVYNISQDFEVLLELVLSFIDFWNLYFHVHLASSPSHMNRTMEQSWELSNAKAENALP